jgi:hypothetical protein
MIIETTVTNTIAEGLYTEIERENSREPNVPKPSTKMFTERGYKGSRNYR